MIKKSIKLIDKNNFVDIIIVFKCFPLGERFKICNIGTLRPILRSETSSGFISRIKNPQRRGINGGFF